MDTTEVRIAAVQCVPTLMDPAANRDMIRDRAETAAAAGARLIVFPECALTGYCFDSLEEARPFAEPVPGPATKFIGELCDTHDCWIVVGMLEADGDRIFNAAVLIGPRGAIAGYRKVHLPFLGIDRFVTPGDRPFAIHETTVGRIGLHICYDCVIPEAARTLGLLGADIAVLPTNWPGGSEQVAAYIPNARALENRMFYVAANRVGEERGFTFIGGSRIVDIGGITLAHAGPDEDTIIYADVNPEAARDKKIVFIPGVHEVHRTRDRRPDWYGVLVQPRTD